MNDVHDFWAGRVSSPPGIKPVYASPPPPPCTPIRRDRLTGAYQMPAPVWQEPPRLTVANLTAAIEQAEAAAPVATVAPANRYGYNVAEKFNHLEVRA